MHNFPTDSDKHTITKAVIYARVSSAHQRIDGDGLNSQIRRCEEYASYKGYSIVETFKDDISGKFSDRPGMKDMLSFLRRQKSKASPHVVIIDDISRLARGLEAHIQLRKTLSAAGGVLESPSIEFGEDSDSQLVEHLLASVSEHQRLKNAEQTKNRMRARVLNGYWVFQAPFGYMYEKKHGHGKVLVPHPPTAAIVKEAIEGFASGRFTTQSELRQWLETLPHFPRDGRGYIRFQRVKDILVNPVYAGMIHAPKWDIEIREGKHEGLVSWNTFLSAQERLHAKPVAPVKANAAHDFILRGFVACDCCGHALTSCWSTGKYKKYPYYLCHTRGCDLYGKSINRNKMEAEFNDLLTSLHPSKNMFDIAMAMFKDAWDQMASSVKDQNKALDVERAKLQKEIDGFLERIIETTNPSVIKAYEGKIANLEGKRRAIQEKQAQKSKKRRPFSVSVRTPIAFLLNPSKLWENGNYAQKRTVLKLMFGAKIPYVRKQGFRTPTLSAPFQLIQGLSEGSLDQKSSNCEMVHHRGNRTLDLIITKDTTNRKFPVLQGQ